MSELMPVEALTGIASKLTQAEAMLEVAKSDKERMRVRDMARAVQRMLEGLDEYLKYQVKASIVVARAERAIVKANPPEQGKRNDLSNFLDGDQEVIKPENIYEMRRVHKPFSDADFESEIAIATENQRPMTRRYLREVSEAKKTGGYMDRAKGDVEWYTPSEYIELVRSVLGAIDLDPASCAHANETVRAAAFYTEAEDGLSQPWSGRVFMNPPFAIELVTAFIDKLIAEFRACSVEEAIVLVNSCTETGWFQDCWRAADGYCFPAKRVKFVNAEGKVKDSHRPQTVFYFGERVTTFIEVFRAKGVVGLTSNL